MGVLQGKFYSNRILITFLAAILYLTVFVDTAFAVYRPLETKEQQRLALEEFFWTLEHQYSALEYKEELYGITPDALRQKYLGLVEQAMTLDEYLGFSEKEAREKLSPEQFRSLIIAAVSEFHDGHFNTVSQLPGASIIQGLKTTALNGRLYVAALSEKLKALNEEAPPKFLDEVVSVNGVSVQELKARNLNYVTGGTIEARKTAALESVLHYSHRLFPEKSQETKVSVTFKRGDKAFTNQYEWTHLKDVDVTGPSAVSKIIERQKQEKDKPFSYGSSGTISYFFLGLVNFINSSRKSGNNSVQLFDIGEAVNFERSANIKKNTSAWAVSSSGERTQKSLTTEEINSLAQNIKNNAPVDRLQAYVIEGLGRPTGVIRLPSYAPDSPDELLNEIYWLMDIIATMKNNPEIDTLIIDQLTNPGGYVKYARLFLELFSREDQPLKGLSAQYLLSETLFNYYLQELPSNIAGLSPEEITELEKQRIKFVESLRAEMEEGNRLSSEHPFALESEYGTSDIIPPNKHITWDRNLVVLIDGRSASAGEIVPAILKDNKRALLIGEKTMGLGFPVVGHVSQLNMSEMAFRCPFAVCTRSNGESIENVGVTPDIEREITSLDLKNGFMNYSLSVLQASQMYSKGEDIANIQKTVDKNRPKPTVTKELLMELEALSADATAAIKNTKSSGLLTVDSWKAIYNAIFVKLEAIESKYTIPEEVAIRIKLPVPSELMNMDPVLRTSQRKDVILRRLEEMYTAGKFNQNPQLNDLVQFLYDSAYDTETLFRFKSVNTSAQSCMSLLSAKK